MERQLRTPSHLEPVVAKYLKREERLWFPIAEENFLDRAALDYNKITPIGGADTGARTFFAISRADLPRVTFLLTQMGLNPSVLLVAVIALSCL